MHQLKKGTDFEIYEMDYYSNSQLQEVCNIKQPVLFEYKNINPNFFHDMDDEHLDILNPHDVNVKDIRDFTKMTLIRLIILLCHTKVQKHLLPVIPNLPILLKIIIL